jgi:hypothetical protein
MLLNQRSRLQGDVNSCNQTLAVYGMLRDIGFGLKEQKLLWHTIREIDDANNISKEMPSTSFSKIYKIITTTSLDESKKDKLQQEVNDLN